MELKALRVTISDGFSRRNSSISMWLSSFEALFLFKNVTWNIWNGSYLSLFSEIQYLTDSILEALHFLLTQLVVLEYKVVSNSLLNLL